MTVKKDISRLKILVVDDDVVILVLLVRILKNIGCDNVTIVKNGKIAIDELVGSKKPFDIIICDLYMPEMDGVELMRHLAEKCFNGGIILISGKDERMLATAYDLAKARNLNVLGALPKPLKPDNIKKLLEIFQPAENKAASQPQTSITEDELRAGISGEELQLVFQPKVNIKTGEIQGIETLSRWHHPERGILGPTAFIPLAEVSSLIDEMTCSVYRKAMCQTGEWLANGINLKVSVNISINTFSLAGFSEFLINVAQDQGVDPSSVVLEVTESQVVANALDCLEIIMGLRMKKFNLSIDDFGTGQSTMEQLKRIPFTELKIDRAFVHGALNDSGARAILESSLELAKRLKMVTVAEGVETKEDWDLVESLECDYVQGYYCAKPMPNEELVEFIETWSGPH